MHYPRIPVPALGATLALALGAAPLAAEPLFPAQNIEPAEPYWLPNTMSVGDLNGDGAVDVVTTTFQTMTGAFQLESFLGNGDGTYQAPVAVPVGTRPEVTAIADFDEDGVPDLAVTERDGDQIGILLGNGDGSFQAPVFVPAGDSPWLLATADLDGDGHADLVAPNDGGRALLGNGDGSFQAPVALGLGPRFVNTLVIHDVDTDGAPDLVCIDAYTQEILLLAGNGDGSFAAPIVLAAGYGWGLGMGDLDEDGAPDLVAPDSTGLHLFVGNGDGSFQAPVPIDSTAGIGPSQVTDLDGDGHLDVAAVGSDPGPGSDPFARVLLGNGDGSFVPGASSPVGALPYQVEVADVNLDGAPDLLSLGRNAGGVSVLLGIGDGSLLAPTLVGDTPSPLDLAAGDLDGDGHADLVTLDAVWPGDGDGGFGPPLPFAAPASPRAFALSDLDADGADDLAIIADGDSDLTVVLGQGDGSFGAAIVSPLGIVPEDLAVGDLDGDGFADAVAVSGNHLTGVKEISIAPGKGDGSFGTPLLLPAAGTPNAVVLADFDGDGALDVATAEAHPANVLAVRLGNGDGTLQAPLSQPIQGTSVLEVGDLNGDGVPDLISRAQLYEPELIVLLGNGDGSFTATSVPLAASSWMRVADVDADGALDVVTLGGSEGAILVAPGNGDGTFGSPRVFAAGTDTAALTVADFDRDGFPDVVTTERSFGRRIWLWTNQLPPRLCDVNADGAVDWRDLHRIRLALWRFVEPGDPRDVNEDGWITPMDPHLCRAECDLPWCQATPACGLLGIEPVLLLGWLAWRRRRPAAAA